jgi:hypothetical protein
MKSGQASAKGRVELDARDWKILAGHLRVFFDHDRDRVEISWACKCGKEDCTVPHTMLAVYVCPENPCPGSNGG